MKIKGFPFDFFATMNFALDPWFSMECSNVMFRFGKLFAIWFISSFLEKLLWL